MTDVALLVLAKASCYDQTFARPDPAIAAAWHEAIGHLDPTDALAAVADHYANQTRRLMPADVIAGVRRIRGDRLAREPEPVPDADPNDVPAYLAALRAGRHRAADNHQPLRPVAQLTAAVTRALPDTTAP